MLLASVLRRFQDCDKFTNVGVLQKVLLFISLHTVLLERARIETTERSVHILFVALPNQRIFLFLVMESGTFGCVVPSTWYL
jgi:hypothetical protein